MCFKVCTDVFKTMWLWFYLQLIGGFKILQEQIWDRHIRNPDFPEAETDKYVVITGGTRGIGLELVKKFLNLKYRVIIGCRVPADMDRSITQAVTDQLIPESHHVKTLRLDLKCMASVDEFARLVKDLDVPVSILVNNAGIMFGSYEMVPHTFFEAQLCTNYLGHFLLTSHLIPALRMAGQLLEHNSRIVNVTSCAHYLGSWMDLEDMQCKEYYSQYGAYGNSKVAQVMFTRFLDQKLQSGEEPIRVHSVHPGVVNTELYERNAKCTRMMGSCLMKSPSQGADTVLYACLAPALDEKGGTYIENTHVKPGSAFSRDEEKQAELWTKTMSQLHMAQFGGAYE